MPLQGAIKSAAMQVLCNTSWGFITWWFFSCDTGWQWRWDSSSLHTPSPWIHKARSSQACLIVSSSRNKSSCAVHMTSLGLGVFGFRLQWWACIRDRHSTVILHSPTSPGSELKVTARAGPCIVSHSLRFILQINCWGGLSSTVILSQLRHTTRAFLSLSPWCCTIVVPQVWKTSWPVSS